MNGMHRARDEPPVCDDPRPPEHSALANARGSDPALPARSPNRAASRTQIEQLEEQAPGALDHHRPRWLQVAMHAPALVRGLHHLGRALEARHELFDR
jgi:hypothetical protein